MSGLALATPSAQTPSSAPTPSGAQRPASPQTPAGAQTTVSTPTPRSGQSLGSVRLTQAVKANGQDLAAGTYTLRLTSDAVQPVVGQSPDAAQWVEFVQGGQVKGREMATKVPSAEVAQIAEGTPPAAGGSKVQLLKGSEYLRVWLNRGETHYLVHLAANPK
jgi:hypothetical protein